MNQVTIYHNPNCGTSRNVLAMIRAVGIEPQIIEYLKTPPKEKELQQILVLKNYDVPMFQNLRNIIYKKLNRNTIL